MCYKQLPYPLSNLSGTVRLSNTPTPEEPDLRRVEFIDLRAVNDMGRFSAKGSQEFTFTRRRFALEVRGADIAFEPELRRALPEEWRTIWRYYRPRGQTDFTARVEVVGDWDKPATVTTDLDLKGCDICCQDFPYEFKNLTGQVRFRPGRTELVGLRSEDSSARIGLEGEIRQQPGKPSLVTLSRIRIEGCPAGGPWQEVLSPSGGPAVAGPGGAGRQEEPARRAGGAWRWPSPPQTHHVERASWVFPIEMRGVDLSLGVAGARRARTRAPDGFASRRQAPVDRLDRFRRRHAARTSP